MEIFHKIYKHGIFKSFKIVICNLYLFWEQKAPWAIKARFYGNLMKLIFTPGFKKNRILGIWDYKALPWSVGDPLVFIEKLSILKIKHNAEEIDICVIYDRENPGGNRAKMRGTNLTSESAQDYMLEFLPLFSTCPYLGSIYQFNSRREFYYFLKNNVERYDIFPPLGQQLGEKYNYYGGAPDVNEIQEFYNAYGYIPYLRISDRDGAWAKWFYLNHLPENTVPITLSLKQTTHTPDRNADPAVWLSFVDECKKNFSEIVFVVVGHREEIFDGLRDRPNVVIAKDFGTSIIEDLALIRTSFIYMGTNSGVNTIAQFSDLPYLLFQWPVFVFEKYGLKSHENFNFANGRQKIFSTEILVTTELLLNEFKGLYSRLDRNKWLSTAFTGAFNKHGHPSTMISNK